MNKTFADVHLTNIDYMDIMKNNLSKNLCLIRGNIYKIETSLAENTDCVREYNIGINYNNKKYNIISYGIQKGDDLTDCGSKIGLFNKIGEKNYNPQLGDFILSSVDIKYFFINNIYDTTGKSGNEINDFTKSLNIPYCSGNSITEQQEKPLQNNSNYYLSGSLILAFVIIGVLVFKLLKIKK